MKKILFIDDEKDLHPVMQEYFPREHFRLVCACDGLEGLQKCRNEEFDLIILDYKMPRLNGVKFYKQLRDIQESKKAELSPVIFISGAIEEIKAHQIKFERAEFLSKPFTKEELFLSIQKISEQKEKTRPGQTLPKIEKRVTLNPGEVLYHQGDEATGMYFVISGLLAGSRKTSEGTILPVGEMGPGEMIGEMCILNNEKRLLTIIAVEKSELMMIPADQLISIVNGQPKWIKIMIGSLSKRLGSTIKKIA